MSKIMKFKRKTPESPKFIDLCEYDIKIEFENKNDIVIKDEDISTEAALSSKNTKSSG